MVLVLSVFNRSTIFIQVMLLPLQALGFADSHHPGNHGGQATPPKNTMAERSMSKDGDCSQGFPFKIWSVLVLTFESKKNIWVSIAQATPVHPLFVGLMQYLIHSQVFQQPSSPQQLHPSLQVTLLCPLHSAIQVIESRTLKSGEVKMRWDGMSGPTKDKWKKRKSFLKI